MNNKGLIGLNIALVIAVIVLFIMQFSGKSASETTTNEIVEQVDQTQDSVVPTLNTEDLSELPTFGSGLKIAFVNMDSLNSNYDYMKDALAEIKKEVEEAQRKMIRKENSFNKKYQRQMQSIQERYQKGELFQDQAEAEAAKLQEEGLRIQQEAQSLTEKLANKEFELNVQVINDTEKFLKVIGDELGYDYVLPYTKTQTLLYAKDAYDITDYVTRKLNEAYAANQSIEEVAADEKKQ